MFSLAFLNFFRSRIAVIGLSFILLAGIVSIHIGQQFLAKESSSIEKTIAFQQEHIARNVRFFNSEIGLLLYYLRFSLINKPSPITALSIGQRDVNPSIQSVTIRNLEGQKYDTDLANPANLLAGNLDFSFVLIYLFPLLIIVFTYNILSEEKESQTWRLVCVQARKPLRMLGHKVLVRAGTVYLALLLLLGYAAMVLTLPFDEVFVGFSLLSLLYLAFWFGLSFWVMSWQRSSSSNAIFLISFWVLSTIICPALVNNYLLNRYPVPEALSTAVEQREGYHEKWDMAKKVTMDGFYAHYPQFRKYGVPDKQFDYLWYYAMQQMGDDDAREQSREMREKLEMRERFSRTIALFIPTLHTQLIANHLAKSDMQNHLKFLDGTTEFHEKLRLYFYPKIFEKKPVAAEDWNKWQVEYFTEAPEMNWISLLMPLLVFSVLLFSLGYFMLKRTL